MGDPTDQQMLSKLLEQNPDVIRHVMKSFTLKDIVETALYRDSLHNTMKAFPCQRLYMDVTLGYDESCISIGDGEGTVDIYLYKTRDPNFEYSRTSFEHAVDHPHNEFSHVFYAKHPLISVALLMRHLEPILHVNLRRFNLNVKLTFTWGKRKELRFSPHLFKCEELLISVEGYWFGRGSSYLKVMEEFIRKAECNRVLISSAGYLSCVPMDCNKSYLEMDSCVMKMKVFLKFNYKEASINYIGFHSYGFNLIIRRWVWDDYECLSQVVFWKMPYSRFYYDDPKTVAEWTTLEDQVKEGITVFPTNGRGILTEKEDILKSFEVKRENGEIAICTLNGWQNGRQFHFRMIVINSSDEANTVINIKPVERYGPMKTRQRLYRNIVN
ncbi:unnamed protein product [Caenorhabditis nigoni]|uniref:Uncharacterized protein n=1 Tax=Caenorhabditis nigoni TaxID=1611254 RepID=A0A2G5SVZ9_9PELO|nr:hypothetical protein B9Z55_024900 [Caenorhabditis nigoni]